MFCGGKSLPDFHELAIKDIFLLCRNMNCSISCCLVHGKHEAIFASLPRTPVINLSPEATVWANDLLRMVCIAMHMGATAYSHVSWVLAWTYSNPLLSLKQIKKKTAQWIVDACQNDYDNADLAIFADILHRSITRLIKSQLEEDLKDSFVHDVPTGCGVWGRKNLCVITGRIKTAKHKHQHQSYHEARIHGFIKTGTALSLLLRCRSEAASKHQ
ncbi:hypothetical protein BJV82DRAFT_108039 [Fennellomyces sp. T-0311]|nr:hypothetical protein BJV82DRAFT_108039 [Fennellomyces sp. T-0311]